MIKTASLENSKRLYELAPEWNDTHFTWKRLVTHNTLEWKDWFLADWNNGVWDGLGEQSHPAPDLEWLLDKLPKLLPDESYLVLWHDGLVWVAQYEDDTDVMPEHSKYADTPSDAACLLLIKLIEQGVVKV